MTAKDQETHEDFGDALEFELAESDEGHIQIGPDVIARIVAIATSEIEGVTLESKFALTDLIGLKGGEAVKGISIADVEGGGVTIGVSVRMAYGRDMYDLAVQLRKHVATTVKKMTRVIVRRVDVRIVGIIVQDMKAPRGEEPKEVEARD